ncbi:unnamed protein product [Clonostachys chloroleuca]|uniref:AB hydrolase-1 domain-containing protein n=1 Tax=Clonostachys chloroleuca TaxID=1926264 RepID=A0AA35QDR7_9HYPO|nr:unnamed protein product [Clonostachys chloroleuca]
MDALDEKRYKLMLTGTGHTYRYYSSVHPDKTTILFIHGFPHTANIWRVHIAKFEKLGFGCVAPDMLGLGGSDKSYNPGDYCSKNLANNLVEILDAECASHAVVIGHDWGCQVASRMALYHTSRVQSLMLAAVPYYTPGSFNLKAINELTAQAVGYSVFGYWDTFLSETKLLKEHTESFFSLFYAQDPELWKNHFMDRGALKVWLENDLTCAIGEYVTELERQEFFANDWAAGTQYYRCYVENCHWKIEQAPEAHIITVPSLMIASSEDACAPLPVVTSTLDSFTDVRLAVLEGGHNAFLSRADEFITEVSDFLRERKMLE